MKTTKKCPKCGNRDLVRIGTQNLKICTDCGTKIKWELKPGEDPIYSGCAERDRGL